MCKELYIGKNSSGRVFIFSDMPELVDGSWLCNDDGVWSELKDGDVVRGWLKEEECVCFTIFNPQVVTETTKLDYNLMVWENNNWVNSSRDDVIRGDIVIGALPNPDEFIPDGNKSIDDRIQELEREINELRSRKDRFKNRGGG